MEGMVLVSSHLHHLGIFIVFCFLNVYYTCQPGQAIQRPGSLMARQPDDVGNGPIGGLREAMDPNHIFFLLRQTTI